MTGPLEPGVVLIQAYSSPIRFTLWASRMKSPIISRRRSRPPAPSRVSTESPMPLPRRAAPRSGPLVAKLAPVVGPVPILPAPFDAGHDYPDSAAHRDPQQGARPTTGVPRNRALRLGQVAVHREGAFQITPVPSSGNRVSGRHRC